MSISRRTLLAATPVALAAAGCAGIPGMNSSSPGATLAPELAGLPPMAPREFRSAWVATVANIDWPSKRGLSTAEQIAEMHAMLDKAVELKFNAIIFQVRTSADAFYDSKLEPWSEYLTGVQGKAPDPYYDPLAMWIAETHKRGMELHAWFNPFRARQGGAKGPQAASHLANTHPEWVKNYGDNQMWIDPGEPAAADHSIAVFKDVLDRYDVDGLHIDDYFYPYAVNDKEGKEIDFPDEPSWQRYVSGGGKLSRADWRRQNVDSMIERIYKTIAESKKPWVRFGVSPFGIGKPSLRPEGISGFSQYDKLYADVERWLAEGWMDYLVPQLYWPEAMKSQPFTRLLEYWHSQNPKQRHIWPGTFTSRITKDGDERSWPVEEITSQIVNQRKLRPGTGHVHFSMVALTQNRRGLADTLKAGLYKDAVLVPATPWLDRGAAMPIATLNVAGKTADGKQLRLRLSGGRLHAVWLRYGETWVFHGPAGAEALVNAEGLNAVVVSALDRVGREGMRSAWRIG